jgi:hypothetical protein
MGESFKAGITRLAGVFTHGVVALILAQPMAVMIELGREMTGDGTPTPTPATPTPELAPATEATKRYRRSPEEIKEGAAKVLALLAENPDGLRAEEVRDKLGLEAKDLPRYFAELKANKAVKVKGEKRATTYTVAPPKAAKPKAKKKVKKEAAPVVEAA